MAKAHSRRSVRFRRTAPHVSGSPIPSTSATAGASHSRWSLLLVAGLVLATATRHRSPGSFGWGEVLLLIWSLGAVLSGILKSPDSALRVSRWATQYWMASLSLLVLGHAVSRFVYIGTDVAGAAGGFAAYIFVAAFSVVCATVIQPRDAERLLITYFRLLVSILGVLLMLTVTGAPGSDGFLYGGARFTGWARNPNQLAFYVAAAPFVLSYSVGKQSRGFARAFDAVLVGVSIAVGLASQSDSLLVAWPIALFAGYALAVWRRPRTGGGGRFWAGVWSRVLAPGLLVVLIVGWGGVIAGYSVDSATSVYQDADQGANRLMLWMNGLDAAARSPLVGLGPGAHSGVYQALSGSEAHNSYIDWMTATGVLGVSLLIALLIRISHRCLRAEQPWLMMAMLSLCLHMVFHHALRHPSLWFMFVVLLAITSGRDPDLER